jgi:hypothetical protein
MTAAASAQPPSLTLAVLGAGAGRTAVYDGEPSSSFALCWRGAPVLLLDAGLGAVAAFQRAFPGRPLPALVYCSHNHTDHSGELPVMLAVEAARRGFVAAKPRPAALLRCFSCCRGATTTPTKAAAAAAEAVPHPQPQPPPLTLVAERRVMRRLRRHRLAELRSTGRGLDAFAHFLALREGNRTEVRARCCCGSGGGSEAAALLRIGLTPLRARHAELAFGLLVDVAVSGGGGGSGAGDLTAAAAPPKLVLGWTADSGVDRKLYAALASAPTVLVDARAAGTAEHAGFDEVAEAGARCLCLGGVRCR